MINYTTAQMASRLSFDLLPLRTTINNPRKPQQITRLSTVARGRKYEIMCRAYLEEHLAMQLTICGGAGDQGVDLRGTCNAHKPLDVIIQCKYYSKKVGPATVREMEGTASYYRTATGPSPVSIICAKSGFTTAGWKRALASQTPLLLLHLDDSPPLQNFSSRVPSLACYGAWKNPACENSLGLAVDILQRGVLLEDGTISYLTHFVKV